MAVEMPWESMVTMPPRTDFFFRSARSIFSLMGPDPWSVAGEEGLCGVPSPSLPTGAVAADSKRVDVSRESGGSEAKRRNVGKIELGRRGEGCDLRPEN